MTKGLTLAEAIEHAEEIGKGEGKCAEDHRWLAEWLKEVQARRARILPEQIKIGHRIYSVKEVENLHADGDELYGAIDGKTETISIDAGLSDEMKVATVLHESLHGIDEMLSIGLDEDTVVRLEAGLAALLSDNPELAYALAEMKDWR